MRVRHPKSAIDAIEAKLAIGSLKAEWMRDVDLASGRAIEPFVHSPKVARAHIEIECVDEPRDERELLGGTDRTTDADGTVVGT